MKNSGKSFITWLVIFAVVMIISNIIGGADGLGGAKLSFSDFMKKLILAK